MRLSHRLREPVSIYRKYGAIDLVTGVCGSLDFIDHLDADGNGATLSTGDTCEVVTASYVYIYRYDATSAAVHNPPQTIKPLSDPTQGRWKLIPFYVTPVLPGVDYLLLEDGSFLLLEDGSKLFLEP